MWSDVANATIGQASHSQILQEITHYPIYKNKVEHRKHNCESMQFIRSRRSPYTISCFVENAVKTNAFLSGIEINS